MNSFLKGWLIGSAYVALRDKKPITNVFQNQFDNVFGKKEEDENLEDWTVDFNRNWDKNHK